MWAVQSAEDLRDPSVPRFEGFKSGSYLYFETILPLAFDSSRSASETSRQLGQALDFTVNFLCMRSFSALVVF